MDNKSRLTLLVCLVTSIVLFSALPNFALAQVSPSASRLKPPPSGLNKGINLGNTLEAPFEGAWGLVIEEFYFDRIVTAGFDHVRMPISWTHHAQENAPFTIDETFFQRVDALVAQCTTRGLKLIINNHHHEEIDADPLGELPRYLAIWDQIATRYQKQPYTVFFEVLNEPHGEFNTAPSLWDFVLSETLSVIRQTNPVRKVLVGAPFWNSASALLEFEMPNDPHLIATFHYYEPFEFTHQGAEWIDPSPPIGVEWHGDRHRLADGWQNWSWGSTVEGTDSGLDVTYDEAWAGFALYYAPAPIEDSVGVSVVLDASSLMKISITDSNGVRGEVDFQPDGSMRSYFFNLTQFGSIENVRRIDVQNLTSNPQPTFSVRGVSVVGQSGSPKDVYSFGYLDVSTTLRAIVAERTAVFNTMKQVAEWGRDNGVPVYMGEFGAYSLADLPSRIRWTNSVRQNAAGWGMGWGYWEFGAGFGIYDPATDQFRIDLLHALLPSF